MQILSSVLDTIGNTPVVELSRITQHFNLQGRLLAKCEHLNPGGSKKDRVALQIIQGAKASGDLKPGQPVLEVTSGNTGTGLAVVCRAMGHEFHAVMSAGNSRERAQMMRALGATVHLIPQLPASAPGMVSGDDMKQVREVAETLIKELNAYFCDQFSNPNNALAHELHTGPELWQQTGGALDAIVAFPGSGGALGGLARYLHKLKPSLRVYAVEPKDAASLATCSCCDAGHAIQGGGYGKPSLTQLDGVSITQHLTISDTHAKTFARLLAEREGILAGPSTGAQLHAAIELLKGPERGNTLAFLICDTGMKYLSTDLYP